MKKYSIFICLILYLLSMSCLNAQEAISSSGNDASGANGKVSYTIGQVSYSYYEGANGAMSQGVQHAYEVSVISSINPTEGKDYLITVYPNPTDDYLIIQTDNNTLQKTRFHLYNNAGEELCNELLTENETRIDMSSQKSGAYIISLFRDEKLIKSYQVVKK